MAPWSPLLLSSHEWSLLHWAKVMSIHVSLWVVTSNHEHSWPDFGVSISKVFVNYCEGEIRAKICHFRGFFYFRWYSWTIIYFRQIFVVLPQDKLFPITFEKDTPQTAGGRLLLNPLTTVFLLTWMTNLGRQGYWWTALKEEGLGEVSASPRGS